MLEMGLITFGCFIMTFAALAFTCYTAWEDNARWLAPRAASASASITLACPLMYFRLQLHFDPVWSDFSQSFAEMGPGWPLAVLFGAATVLIGSAMIWRLHISNPASSRASRLSNDWNSAMIVMLTVGFAATIIGYFLVWSRGDVYTMYGADLLRRSGTAEGPLMLLVPFAAATALFLTILSQVSAHRAGVALLHASRCMAAMGLSLAFFWGLVIGEYQLFAVDLTVTMALQPGWYIFFAGQVTMMASLVLIRHDGTGAADKA